MHPQRRHSGFTLLEILIVVFLIATLSWVLLPVVGGGFSTGIVSASRLVAADLRYAAQCAIATGHLHRWTLDLDRQAFRIEWLSESEPERDEELPETAELLDLTPPRPQLEPLPVDDRTGEWHSLEQSSVMIDSVRIADLEYEEGLVSIAFSADGGADPAEIRLIDDSGYRIDLRVLAFTGEVRVIEEPDTP